MAKDKKSFVLYADLIHTVNIVDNETAGALFKHVLAYCNDLNPKSDNVLLLTLFEPIKQQLKRDLIKYEKRRKIWSDAGKKSAEVRKSNKNQQTLNKVKPPLTKSTVNVNDSVNVNVNDINNYITLLKKENSFLDGLYTKYKLRKGTMPAISIKFQEHLKVFPTVHNNFSDFKRHLANWIGIEKDKGRLSNYVKGHQKGDL